MKKYTLYAIGEILLVVIGILIALQINNWNNEKTNRIAEKEYLNQLVIELDSDIKTLETDWERLHRQLPVIEELLKILNKEKFSRDDFNNNIYAYLNTALYPMTFNSNSATFDEMKSSGKFAVISDKELRNDIVRLYKNLESLEITMIEINDFTRDLSVDLAIKKRFAKYMDYQKDTFSKYNSPQELYSMKRHKESIMNHVINQNWNIFELKPIYNNQLEEIRDIASQIRNHLKAKFSN